MMEGKYYSLNIIKKTMNSYFLFFIDKSFFISSFSFYKYVKN